MYRPKVIRGRLKTGGKTAEQLVNENSGYSMEAEELVSLKKGYDLFDGLAVALSLWDYDNYSSYHLLSWDKKDDKKVMEAIYQFEQDSVFGSYQHMHKKFVEDWNNNQYSADGVLCFELEDVEVLEVLQEEVKEDNDGKTEN